MSRPPGLAPAANVIAYRVITFRVHAFYDEWELEVALQTLIDRGADYFDDKDSPAEFEVRIPAEFDPQPYIATLEMATAAITDIELQPELRTMIYAAPVA